MEPWQLELLKGYSTKELRLFSAGRAVGKSYISKIYNMMKEDTALVCEEGKVFGKTYYVVHPRGIGHSWHNMTEWLIQTMGATNKQGAWYPDERWYANNSRFWFRNETDRTMFLMRWS